MKYTEQMLARRYRQMDLDPCRILQDKTYERICAKNHSFKRKAVWVMSAACAACVLALAVWWPRAADGPYLPDPAEFNRMNFAFYRDLALPGQDLGISYDDLPSLPS